MHRAANNLTTEECIAVGKNWCFGSAIKLCQWRITLIRFASTIDIHQVPEDRRVSLQRCSLLQHTFERQITGPGKSYSSIERCYFPANLLQPKPFITRVAVHH